MSYDIDGSTVTCNSTHLTTFAVFTLLGYVPLVCDIVIICDWIYENRPYRHKK